MYKYLEASKLPYIAGGIAVCILFYILGIETPRPIDVIFYNSLRALAGILITGFALYLWYKHVFLNYLSSKRKTKEMKSELEATLVQLERSKRELQELQAQSLIVVQELMQSEECKKGKKNGTKRINNDGNTKDTESK